MDDIVEEKDKEIHMSFVKVVTATMHKLQYDRNIITEPMERFHLESKSMSGTRQVLEPHHPTM